MSSFPPPEIPANELRPTRHWYVTAAAIAVTLITVGVVIVVYRYNDMIGTVDADNQFANGDTITVPLEPESEKAIWVGHPGPDGQECRITGPGDPGLTDPGIDVFLTRDETWNPLYTIDVSRAGDYEVTCSSQEPVQYAIGDTGGFFTFVGGLMLAILLAILGIGICAVIVLVTVVRRIGHRKRLLAERYGPDRGHPVHPGPSPGAGPADRERRPALRKT